MTSLLDDEEARWAGELDEHDRALLALESRDRADEHEGLPPVSGGAQMEKPDA